MNLPNSAGGINAMIWWFLARQKHFFLPIFETCYEEKSY